METARSLGTRYHMLSLVCMILLMLLSSVAVAIYFVNRMDLVLRQSGIVLTGAEHADLLHLQIQFLIGMLAMMALVIVFLMFNRLYTTYKDREARSDSLTGVLRRKAFFQSCGKALNGLRARGDACGYFIMIDLDRFKEINDCCGHPEGDRVLKETARELEEVFSRDGFIGRVGGDEFAVLFHTPVKREELEQSLRRFQARLHTVQGCREPISCSIGAQPITADQTADELYRAADSLLYLAKGRGKNQYVIGPAESTAPTGTAR